MKRLGAVIILSALFMLFFRLSILSTTAQSHPSQTNEDQLATNLDTSLWTITTTNDEYTVMNSHTPHNDAIYPKVSIYGPIAGLTQTMYTFTATVTPWINEHPLTYIWQTVDPMQIITNTNRGIIDNATFTWTTPNSKPITVTVIDSDTMLITVYTTTITTQFITPTQVCITGPVTQETGTMLYLTTTVLPITTTPYITSVWKISDQPTVTHVGWVPWDTLPFSVTLPGEYTATVTVYNSRSILLPVTDSFSFTLLEPINIALDSVSIDGPIAGAVNLPYHFEALIEPISATQPISYIWETSDDDGEISKQFSQTAIFTWQQPGAKLLTVTVRNEETEISCTHSISLTEQPITPTGVLIKGDAKGYVKGLLTFTAKLIPITTTPPITYIWTTENKVITTSENLPESTRIFSWSLPGLKVINVKAINGWGTVTATHIITLKERSLYLSLVLRDWPPIPSIPHLLSINNSDGDGNYVVVWEHTQPTTTTEYILQEAIFSGHFTIFKDSFREIYSGTTTSLDIIKKGPTHYSYRVKACNKYKRCSDWSNIQDVDVLWEMEDNSAISLSNGPLVSGNHYYGIYNDQWDCYKIILPVKGKASVQLSTTHTDTYLGLYNNNRNLIDDDDTSPYSIESPYKSPYGSTLSSGQYYICIYTDSEPSEDTYVLTVDFP